MFSNLSPFTKLHVVISLIGIVSGLVVMSGLLSSRRLNGWTALFLISTVLTSVTGLFFPFHGVTPGIVLAIISLVLLAVAILPATPGISLAPGVGYMCSRDDLAVSERLCFSRSTFSESACPESAGAT